MIVNSELPLCLLQENMSLNEYDFVLFHLYNENETYRNYYDSIKGQRTMILDNSGYEYYVKGETLDFDDFADVCRSLKPTYYILPDVLMSRDKTLGGAFEFIKSYGKELDNIGCRPIGVAQGESPHDLIRCMNMYKDYGIDCIAIPFHNKFFKDMGYDVDTDIKMNFLVKYNGKLCRDHYYAMGRIQFVRDFMLILNQFDYVHFLGSHCPLEKMYYGMYNSMDTSYPVKCAIAGHMLFEEPGKPDVIIDDFLERDLSEKTKELIKKNIQIFRNL